LIVLGFAPRLVMMASSSRVTRAPDNKVSVKSVKHSQL